MTTFTVSLENPSAAGGYADAILRSLKAAADSWAAHLQGYGSIAIRLTIDDNGSPGAIATGGTTYRSSNGSPFVPDTVSEVRTGNDPNGSDPDIYMTLNPAWVSQLFYDASSPVPPGQVDAFSVFQHEIGHGLGISDLGGSTYDALVRTVAGQAYFTGANARLAYGGDLPLDADRSHLGVDDLMDPYAENGARDGISGYDVAILQDIGMPIATLRADIVALGANGDRFLAYSGNDTVFGADGADELYGNQGADVLYGNVGNDALYGGVDGDALYGGRDDDVVSGNLGADLLLGNLGRDALYGGQGADTLYGGQGDDLIAGDLGDDVLSGDLGADRYLFGAGSGADLVLGFSLAEGDRLDFAGQTYALGSTLGGSALFALSGGGTVELAGVTAAQAAGIVA